MKTDLIGEYAKYEIDGVKGDGHIRAVFLDSDSHVKFLIHGSDGRIVVVYAETQVKLEADV